MDRRTYLGFAGAAAATLAGCASDGTEPTQGPGDRSSDEPPTPTSDSTATPTVHAGYETTTVRAVSAAGETLGSVTAAIADTSSLRYTGLSDTETLPSDRGMLFVYATVADRTFVMRRMDFGIDIVYADANGTITSIHHAPAPSPDEDGNDQRYPGRGQFVLEVNYDWTTDHGVSEGDSLEFTLPS
jgi:uncharacterized membrane protein (UPF0127 family)